MTNHTEKKSTYSLKSPTIWLCILALQLCVLPKQFTQSFSPTTLTRRSMLQMQAASSNMDDDTSRALERARVVLAKSKAKLEAKERKERESIESTSAVDEPATDVPFFAAATKDEALERKKRKEKVLKNINKETGLSTFDGDLMAELSELEEWEVLPLLELFKNEKESKKSIEPFVERDVAASVYNLRKSMQLEDFQKIFNPRNRFIGEL
jgi:hypothetical protein